MWHFGFQSNTKERSHTCTSSAKRRLRLITDVAANVVLLRPAAAPADRVGGWYPRRHDEAVQDDRGSGSLRQAFDIWRMACDSDNGPRLGKLNALGFANRFSLVPVAMPTCWGKSCPTAGSPTTQE